jgi:hypothetical protein
LRQSQSARRSLKSPSDTTHTYIRDLSLSVAVFCACVSSQSHNEDSKSYNRRSQVHPQH